MLTTLTVTMLVFGAVIVIIAGSIAFRLIEMRSSMGTLFHRVEAKLEANIKFDPHANLPREVTEAVRAGEKIQAIKLFRDSTGVGLKAAKEFIEEFQRHVK